MFRLIAALVLACALAACTSGTPRPTAGEGATPSLRLAPSALPGGLALQQRLTFRHGDRHDTVDALVESDADETRLVIHSQGQVALRLRWDGRTLDEQRGPGLPDALQAARVLDDLQLVFWPMASIAAALPPGWTISGTDVRRELRQGRELVASVEFPAPGRTRLLQHRLRYELDIVSLPVAP